MDIRIARYRFLLLTASLAPIAFAFVLRKPRRSSPFAAGLLIGVGVAALIEGICFASMWLK